MKIDKITDEMLKTKAENEELKRKLKKKKAKQREKERTDYKASKPVKR